MPTTTQNLLVTTRFGEVEVAPEDLIQFEDGLIGFPQCKTYFVMNPNPEGAFRYLQSIDVPALAFLVVEPRHYVPDYAPTISSSVARELELVEERPPLVFVTVSIPRGHPEEMTINLAGPIVINAETRCAKQVIVEDESYTTKHRVFQPANQAQKAA